MGAGAIIVRNRSVLLVQEANGLLANLWGFPSGLLNPRESIADGMQREVFEETKLKVQYKDIIYFRQVNKTKWNRPDLYFGC